jgi:hypothetical protein
MVPDGLVNSPTHVNSGSRFSNKCAGARAAQAAATVTTAVTRNTIAARSRGRIV